MLDMPLHPILVHFPLVIVVILPFLAVLGLLASFRQNIGRKIWVGVVGLQFLLVVFGFFALQTGEGDEERVESVLISDVPLEFHAEKAEFFFKSSLGVLAVSALGLVTGTWGTYGRIIGSLGSLLLLFLGIQVGHSGGQLVYKHGAANAYLSDALLGEKKGMSSPKEMGNEHEKKEREKDED